MPFTLEKELIQTSERVKSVDFHPTQPWILGGLHSGSVRIWNYQSQQIEKSFKITDSPVRSAKFVIRENWVVAAYDDGFIRVYNYNTLAMIKEFQAHQDYIRCLAVHPTLPFLLSSSDDKLIKLWDWSNGWTCTQVFEGHSHYVMDLAFNPADLNAFASASLDGTLKIWNVEASAANHTLEAHSKGINCVEYFMAGDKLCLISGSDDYTVKIWDYETKCCVQTLEGHMNNVTAVCAHPELPIIITCSEDATVRIWNSIDYRMEKTFNYGLERVWTVASMKGSSQVVFGCDKGTIMVKLANSAAKD